MTRALASGLLLVGFLLGAVFVLWADLGHAQSPDVADAIHQAAVRHGVSEGWLRRVAWCESRFFPGAVSRGGHQGLFQYASATWRWMSWQAGWGGSSPFDAYAAADVTAWAFAHGYSRHWSCA